MEVLAISGSLRRDSYNTKLLRAAAMFLPPGARLVLVDGLKALPAFSEDDEAHPALSVQALRRQVAHSDAVLIATPEYNHSVPGQLKNALDWLSRPFASNPLKGKPVAVIGASTGIFGALWAQAETRKVLTAIGARVDERELPVASAADQFDADGQLHDPELREQLRRIVRDLAARSVPEAA